MYRKSAVLVLVVSITTAGLATAGDGNRSGPRILPPQSHSFGKTYGEWGAAWQQWVFYSTTENCPVTDTTGERGLVNQSGSVYFLAGTFGEMLDTPWYTPSPVTRNATFPPGKALCIPVNNWGLVYPDDIPFTGAPAGATWEEAMPYFYATLNAFYDNMNPELLECVVDGVRVPVYRAQSDPFMVYAPAENVQSDIMDYFYPGLAPFYEEGWYISVSDGYYVMLAPLPAGGHTIHIHFPDFFEVTYHLTVANMVASTAP